MRLKLNTIVKSKRLFVIFGIITALVPSLYWYLNVSYLFILPIIAGIFVILSKNFKKNKAAFLILFSFIGWFFPIIIYSLLNRSVEMLFIVPDGYYGEVSITKHNGATAGIPKVNGKYVIDFSTEQNLTFKHESVLKKWMNIEVINHSGEILVDSGSAGEGRPAVLESMGTTPGSVYIFENNEIVGSTSSTELDGTVLRWKINKTRGQNGVKRLN
jgi:hypothetical protein